MICKTGPVPVFPLEVRGKCGGCAPDDRPENGAHFCIDRLISIQERD